MTLGLRQHYEPEREGYVMSCIVEHRVRMLASAIALLALGCDANESFGEAADALEPPPEPADHVPAALRNRTWISKWDNPPMMGSYRHQGLETTEATTDAWVHTRFDLMTRPSSSAGDYDFFAVAEPGTYGTGDTMKWLSHGLRLPPRVTGDAAEGIVNFFLRYNDSTPGSFEPYTTAASLQLDQGVILVPIHVIQLYVAGDGSVDDGWYSQARAAVTYDDDWLAYDYIENIDPLYPYQVTHDWGEKPGSSPVPAARPARPGLDAVRYSVQTRFL